LDLDDNIKEKLKNSYKKAIKTLKTLFLLYQKEYFDYEYKGIYEEKNNIRFQILNIIKKYNLPRNIEKIFLKQDFIEQIAENEFIELINNPL
jgi:hypothetical protein